MATAAATTRNGNGGKSRISNGGNGHGNGSNGNGHNGHSNGKASGARRIKLEKLFVRWEELKATCKATYTEIDAIEAELIESLPLAEEVQLSDGRRGQICDNFVDKNGIVRNVSYKPCGVRRFEPVIR